MIRPTSLVTCVLGSMVMGVLRAQRGPDDYVLEGASVTRERDDYREVHLQGGFRLVVPGMGLTIRGQNALLLFDLEVARAAAEARGSGLPSRGIAAPEPRRRVSLDTMRERLARTLGAIGGPAGRPASIDREAVDLFRYLYCEGGIVVVQRGVEVLRCDRLWISPIDDRVVVENAELRYTTGAAGSNGALVVRGPRLVKQGGRWVGRDVVLTTCTAAEPHAALGVEEVEIIERDGEFEVVARGQTLQVGGASILPLPDARFFTGSQSEFPIRRASLSYSGQLGVQAQVVFGLPWNATGGRLHEWLTGRPASEFRGDWELGVGWIQERGVPLEGALTYAADGVYEGRIEAFWLDDTGRNLREIQFENDGSLIDNEQRGLLRTQNRLHLGPTTHFDLVAFHASDPAVYSDFFLGPYRNDELPETSGYLHHADGNHLLTVGGRTNLADFSYRDDRALASRFVEELPVVTYQWLAEPIGNTPWKTPIVLDLETDISQRRSDYEDVSGLRASDRTLRADQLVELSFPFHLGGLNVRPYTSGRGTFYDRTVDGGAEERGAFEGGVQFGTRMSRTWSGIGDDGPRGIRHVIAPRLTYQNRFHVDDRPDEFRQYDFDPIDPFGASTPRRSRQLGYQAIDRLTERELVRFEVRNLVQEMSGAAGEAVPRDFVFLDLAQDFFPDKSRDNEGDTLGLFYYDLLLRPRVGWLPLDDFALGVYGDRDWQLGMQTLDAEVRFGRVLGCSWTIDYREDRITDGALGVTASARLLDRWTLFVGSQRDLNEDRWLGHTASLQRDDHDWSLAVTATYNPFFGETVFRVEFLPRLGGLNQPRRDRLANADLRSQSVYDY